MRRKTKIIFSRFLVAVLIAVTTLSLLSCSHGQKEYDTEEKTVTVLVTHKSGEEKVFTITTTAENLGDALVENDIVDGEDGQYGLYITAVDGEVADYSVDQSFWALSKGGEELFTGASSTPVSDGDVFELTYTVFE